MNTPFFFRLTVLAAIAVLAPINSCGNKAVAQDTSDIHQQVLTVDSHIDWPFRQSRNPDFNPGIEHETGQPDSGQWDLIRMQQGGLDAAFMSIFVPQGDRTEAGHADAKALADRQIDLTQTMVDRHSNLAAIALSPDDAYAIEQSGRRAIFMGMENGYPIGSDINNLHYFYDRGIRYITLTHSKNNELADSSTDSQQEWDGVSPTGAEVIRTMNRLGMMIDISHVHDDTFWDVIELSEAPLIASHSSARALRDVPRNMSDDMLRAISNRGGVVQVCLLGDYIKHIEQSPERQAALDDLASEREAWLAGELNQSETDALIAKFRTINKQYPERKPTISDAVDHIDHMVDIMGIDAVGIGSDFDGGGGLADLVDVSEMPNITQELLDRGYSDQDIEKLWGGNLMRVFQDVNQVAQTLQ